MSDTRPASLLVVLPHPDAEIFHGGVLAHHSDRGGRVAREYRLAFMLSEELRKIYQDRGRDLADWNGGDWTLPVPGTFVIAPDRRIALAHVDADYRSRLDPSVVIAVLRELGK